MLLNRLLKKKAVRAVKEGRRFLYSPAITRDDWVLSESKGLLDRLFAGRVAPLAAHFSRHGKLTQAGHHRSQEAHRGDRRWRLKHFGSFWH